MAEINELLGAVNALKESQEKLDKRLEGIEKSNESGRKTNPASPAPSVRVGEDPMTSRGFSFLRLFGLMSNQMPEEYCKVERDLVSRLQAGHDRAGFVKGLTNSVLVPFGGDLMTHRNSPIDAAFASEIKDVVVAGTKGVDPEQVAHWRQKAMSWTDELNGGALVGPPVMGELIDLLRPQEVFMRAGARVIGMPPNGRIVYPRQTGASTSYWVGESASISDSSTPTTGDLILSAKKLAVLVKIPNELFRFASISVEQFVREDIAKQVGLRLDNTLLEGVGSTLSPKGLINYAGVQTHTVTSNELQPEDCLNMVAKVEDYNAKFGGWIMRPLLWARLMNRRAGSGYSADDGKGMFLWMPLRGSTDGMKVGDDGANLAGYPVYKTTNISKTRGGTSNRSYVLGGDFSDYLIALSGAMEFQVSQVGDTPLTNDQTWFRGILFADGAPRHEASFIFADGVTQAS